MFFARQTQMAFTGRCGWFLFSLFFIMFEKKNRKNQSLKSFLKASTTEERYVSDNFVFTSTEPVCESAFLPSRVCLQDRFSSAISWWARPAGTDCGAEPRVGPRRWNVNIDIYFCQLIKQNDTI